MALNTELQRKAPKTSWWADSKTRGAFNRALESRLEEGMPPVPTPVFGLNTNTATMIAKRRKQKESKRT